MTRRERVYRAVGHQESDKVPWHIELTIPAAENLAAKAGCATEELDEWIGNHLYMVAPHAADAWQQTKPGYCRDEFGVVWNRTVDPDIGVIEHYQLGDRSLDDFSLPDPEAPERWEHFEAELE